MVGHSSAVKQVIMLTLGWEELPKAWSVHGCDPKERLIEPVPALLIETIDGWVLLDTGFNKALIQDSALYDRFHSEFYEIKPILPAYELDPLLDALERHGLEIDRLLAVGVSHLHNDHAGGLRHLGRSKTPIYIQSKELEFGLGDITKAQNHGLARVDYDDPRLNYSVISGDVEIAPGIHAISTPGHTPGHQSFMVDYPQSNGSKGFIFAFDAGDLVENFELELAIGGFIDVDAGETIDQIRKLKSLAVKNNMTIVPGHDPDIWPTTQEGLSRIC